MEMEVLRAEAVAATIVLTPTTFATLARNDVRPSLLAAQLGADRRCQSAADWQPWHREYQRILALLGWCHTLAQEQTLVCQPGQRWVPWEQLSSGLQGLSSPTMKRAVTATLDALAAGPREAPGWAILERHCWAPQRLRFAVAFIDTDASLVTCAVDYQVQHHLTQLGFAHALTCVTPGTPVHLRTSVARLGAQRDCTLASHLTRRLHTRLETETGPL